MTIINVVIDKAQKLNGEYSLFITFDYDAQVVDVIRDLPSKWWHADIKTWEVPLMKLPVLLQKLPLHQFNISGQYVVTKKETHKIPDGFSFKTTPFEHQREAFQFGLDNDKWLLGDEQGLGKTKQSIDIAIAKKLEKGYQHCLIICGVNGLKWNWQKEIEIHSNEHGYILGQKLNSKKQLVIGSNTDKYNDVLNLHNNSNYFIITNVESLRNEDICKTLVNRCKSGEIGMIITDEVHKMKNPTSQQGKAFLKLQAETMIAMTGTPLMNNPFDLYIILKWLGVEKNAFYSFKKHYGEFGGYGGYEVIGYKHLDELQEQLNSIMLRRRKADVLDLPEKVYIDEYVDLTPKQAQIYKEVTADIMANIDQIKMDSNPLAQLIRLRQATGYTGILSSVVQESAKLDRMEELVDEAIENGNKVVIFSNWTQVTDEVQKRLSRYHSIVITGQTKDADRQPMVDAFQNDPNVKVAIGSTGAMGTGLTLTAGTVEIFLDEPWSKALKDQAEDRCHRVGTTQNVTIYTLLTKDTIDERIHDIVEQKGKMADAMVDGKVNMDKGKLVDFLLS